MNWIDSTETKTGNIYGEFGGLFICEFESFARWDTLYLVTSMFVIRFVPYTEHVASLSLMDTAMATLFVIWYFDKLHEICVLVSTDCNQFGEK